jgi:hypothetical protein
MAMWRNWYTQQFTKLWGESPWGFESPRRAWPRVRVVALGAFRFGALGCRKISAAAAMRVQRPNDTRVRGAGPARKTFLRPKACKAPHPLQPLVRRRTEPVKVSETVVGCN